MITQEQYAELMKKMEEIKREHQELKDRVSSVVILIIIFSFFFTIGLNLF